jgi:plastocyanin
MLRAPSKPAAAVLAAALVPLPLHKPGRHHPAHHGPRSHRERTHSHPPGLRSHRGSRHDRSGAHRNLILAFGRRPSAHVAGDPADTISDFKFTPATITIHVGDTVTWTNEGPSPHTATAKDGSFDTGTLKKGASASHTFSAPGTYSYICTIHPFMHGSIVVLANSSSTTSPSGTSGSGSGSGATAPGSSTTSASTAPASSSATGASQSSSPASTTASAGGRMLPVTGSDLQLTIGASCLLIGLGAIIRQALRARS